MKKLPNLDGLRFIAASLVLIYHVDLALSMNHYKAAPSKLFPFNFGHLAVVLFFVLSGFLITHLLLKEKAKQEISVRTFYLKRVLRIWPLYYLIVILSFLIFNRLDLFKWNDFTTMGEIHMYKPLFVFLIVIICPNIALLSVNSIGYAGPTWSIGVEEQFYLIWPHIMKTKRPQVLIAVIIVLLLFLNNNLLSHTNDLLVDKGIIIADGKIYKALFTLNRFFTYPYCFKIDAMAIGAAGAMMAFYRSRLLPFIFSVTFQLVFYALLLLSLFFLVDILPYQVFCLFFIVLILNLALNERSIVNLQYKPLEYFGKISYGIYLFHSITIIPCIKLVQLITNDSGGFLPEILVCLLSLAATISIAAVSYKYFESYFLAMKDRLQTVKS